MLFAMLVLLFSASVSDTATPATATASCSRAEAVLDSIGYEIGNGGTLTVREARAIRNVATKYADSYKACECSEALEEVIFDMSVFIDEASSYQYSVETNKLEEKMHHGRY